MKRKGKYNLLMLSLSASTEPAAKGIFADQEERISAAWEYISPANEYFLPSSSNTYMCLINPISLPS